ncbi:hypothetical protein [Streptomyces scopuliridis]|uniref:hypothetical protein n=1 Tax=Streptomyces scopuliridis TaxID=452529 RepID=UPI0036B53A07
MAPVLFKPHGPERIAVARALEAAVLWWQRALPAERDGHRTPALLVRHTAPAAPVLWARRNRNRGAYPWPRTSSQA